MGRMGKLVIKIEEIEVWGFKHAIRGMRNSHRSWDKSDSGYGIDGEDEDIFIVGQNDLGLMQKLCKAGPSHRKYLRQIFISMDITAPLYLWKEFDTYKIGTTGNSDSTMHNIQDEKFEFDNFSCEHLNENSYLVLARTIEELNLNRALYLQTGDKVYWWQMIQLLPSTYNQLRTETFNYEVVINMIDQRENHKLDEWNIFCDTMLENLPYLKEIMKYDKTNRCSKSNG